MAKFNVGDRVRVKLGAFSDHCGKTGTLTSIEPRAYPFRVRPDGMDKSFGYYESELELVSSEPEIVWLATNIITGKWYIVDEPTADAIYNLIESGCKVKRMVIDG
jgi:hypothetical protein